MRGTHWMSGLVVLLGWLGTASGGPIVQVSHTCGPEKCCEAPGCQPRSCRPVCMHSKFWKDLGKRCCGSDRGCCKNDGGNTCCPKVKCCPGVNACGPSSHGCCPAPAAVTGCCPAPSPNSCCPAPSPNSCCPAPMAAKSCCPAPVKMGCCPAPESRGFCGVHRHRCCPKPCCEPKPCCTPNKGCCSVHGPCRKKACHDNCCPKACHVEPKCCPKACPETRGTCGVHCPKQVCKSAPCAKECPQKCAKEKRVRYRPDQCEQIAHLIYVSQTGCSARIRGKALDRLGDKFDCTCHPEIMCAFLYGLNDCDANVRWHAADEIGDQIEKHGCCCINAAIVDALIVTLSDCHPKVIHQAEEALKAAGYDLRECYRDCGRNESCSDNGGAGIAPVHTGSATPAPQATVSLGKPEAPTSNTSAAPYVAPSVTPNSAPEAAPSTTSVSVGTPAQQPLKPTAPKAIESDNPNGTDLAPSVPGPEATVEPETYFPTRIPDAQSRKGSHRSQLANLFGLG